MTKLRLSANSGRADSGRGLQLAVVRAGAGDFVGQIGSRPIES